MAAVSPGLKLYLAQQGRWAASRAERRLREEFEAGREHGTRARERLGAASCDRPDGPLLWVHTAGGAETLAILELASRLRMERDELSVLITTTIFDPDGPLAEPLPPGVIHQFAPYEFVTCVQDFVAHWRPDICLWADDGLRPALIEAAHAAGVALFMIDGRISEEHKNRWRWFPGIARALLSRFDGILACDAGTAASLRRQGAPARHIQVAGVLQEGSEPLPFVPEERDAMATVLAARPVWLAAGVAPAEDEIVSAAHRHAIRRAHRLLLVVVPDRVERGEALAEALRAEGWAVARRGAGEDPDPDIQVFVADLPDELGLWYRLAPSSFIGQTLSGGPGRNPFEAAALGSAVLFGPEGRTFHQAYGRLEAAGAAIRVRDGRELGAGVEFLLAPDVAARMATAAWDVATSGAEVTDRICELVFETLDEKGL